MLFIHYTHPLNIEQIWGDGLLTFKTSGVEFNEELGSACRLYYGFNAFKFNVCLLGTLWQTFRETCDVEVRASLYLVLKQELTLRIRNCLLNSH